MSMLAQSLIVALLVLGSSVYAGWSLMPAGAKRDLAERLLRWPRPGWAARPLKRATVPVSGCGSCGGCAGATPPRKAPAVQTVTFHRRLP